MAVKIKSTYVGGGRGQVAEFLNEQKTAGEAASAASPRRMEVDSPPCAHGAS